MRYKEEFTLFRRGKKSGGKVWYYRLAADPKRIAHSTQQVDRHKALLEVKRVLAKAAPVGASTPLRQLLEPYYVWETCPHTRRLLDLGKSITRRHVEEERRLLVRHVFPDPIGKVTLGELGRGHLLDFRDRLRKQTGTRTVNRVIACLKTVFREAIFREQMVANPCAGLGELAYEKRVVGVLSRDELARLFPMNPPGPWVSIMDYCVFLLAASTGMRRGEILAMRWSQVDIVRRVVTIDRAWKGGDEVGNPKSGKPRQMRLSALAARALYALRDGADADDLAFHKKGERLGGTWWQKHWTAGMARAFIDARARGLKPHSLRHSANSILRALGVDPAQIRAGLGWSDALIQETYTHWTEENTGALASAVDSVIPTPAPREGS